MTDSSAAPNGQTADHWAAIKAGIRQVADLDHLAGLALTRCLIEAAEALQAEVAQSASAAGVSWARIAEPIGLTKQGAYDRYGKARPATPATGRARDITGYLMPGDTRTLADLMAEARNADRWRGMPSASRIMRELGVPMKVATSLAKQIMDSEAQTRES
jgi:hypothetical protein